jgi:ribosomal protein S18 acetylase RimI-like enzyme
MKIRPAAPIDHAAIAVCDDLAFRPYLDEAPGQACAPGDELGLQIQQGSIHVICDRSDILGFISLAPADDHLFIDAVAVLPKHHGQGLGTKLMAFAESEAQRNGLDSVRFYTMAAMRDSISFYERRGYTETARCDDDGYPRIFFAKDKLLPSAARRANT